MIISNFDDFIFESELKNMPFYMSEKLLNIIEKIKHPIADDLLNTQKKGEMSKYTLVDTDLDGTEYVTYIPSDKLRSTVYSSFDDENALRLRVLRYPIEAGSANWDKSRTKLRIGKMVKSLFPKYSDKQIEEFVHTFKSVNGTEDPVFRIVQMSHIGHFYQVQNYSPKWGRHNPLWNSCMNDKDFFDIYIFNPKVCKMLILTEDEIDEETGEIKEKLLGRALLWNTNKGWFMDRIYYIKELHLFQFIQWAKKNSYLYKSENKSGKTEIMKDGQSINLAMEVNIDGKIESYLPLPYLDTFFYGYDTNDGDSIISNQYPAIQTIMSLKAGEDRIIYKMTDEEGGYNQI